MFEVDEKTESKFGDAKIIEHLSAFMIRNPIDDFSVDDYVVVSDEIGGILANFDASVCDGKTLLLGIGDFLVCEFYNKCVFVWFFMKSVSQRVMTSMAHPINWKTASLNIIFASIRVHSRLKKDQREASISSANSAKK